MDNFKRITSRENSLIKLTSALQNSAKERKEKGLFVLEGLRICTDAYDNGIRFDKLILSDTAYEKFSNQIAAFSSVSDESYIITDLLFKKISDTSSPQGIIVIAKRPTTTAAISKTGKYIALENLADPSNLGAVSRTAEAFGVDGIILSDNGCDPYSPKALRASMGTLLRMPVFIFEDFADSLKKMELTTYACVVDSDVQPINEVDFSKGSILIIGNEANGITEKTKLLADQLITIPMCGNTESLNAAVAAAISMWEMMK